GLGIRVVPHAAPGDWEHDLDQQIFTAICGEHLRRKLPSASTSKMRDRWTHHEHEAYRPMSLHDSVERHEVADVARAVIVRRCRKLHENRQAEGRDLVPERCECRVIEMALIAMTRKMVRVVQALEAKNLVRTIDFGKYFVAIRDRFVDVQQTGELLRMLVLREGIVVVHRTVAAARLQDAMI